jgi:hypothetical protein
MKTDLPLIAALTPDAPVALPEGATVFDSPIRGGLPHLLPLLPRWRVVLGVPTGSAHAWLDAPPTEPVTGAAPRLRFQLDGSTRHVVPLVRGDGFAVVDDGRTLLRAVVLDWAIHAGDMQGPGDYGSFLKLAVMAVDKGVNAFGPIPPSDFVITALPPQDRSESRPGWTIPLRYQRLLLERVRRHKELM